MNWEVVLYFVTTVLAVVIGTALYEWVRAERDEREWRKILEEEMKYGVETPLYRLVRDEKSDRE